VQIPRDQLVVITGLSGFSEPVLAEQYIASINETGSTSLDSISYGVHPCSEDYNMGVLKESVGLSTLIVSTLQEYGTIPIDFLAKVLGRRTPEIQDDLDILEQERVIHREGENVRLASKSRKMKK
jgi:hypothetical protein